MSIDFGKYELSAGNDIPPDGDRIFHAAGITASLEDFGDLWIDRIQCYGRTQEEARALRDRVLKGLELVAEQEREEEMSRQATQRMVDSGLLVIGTAKIGSQLISAGLGEKTTIRMSNEYKVKGDD